MYALGAQTAPMGSCVNSKMMPQTDEGCELTYNMSHAKRGKAIIFNHYKFEDRNLSKRKGTDNDAKRLTGTLENLKFVVEVKEDLRVGQIRKVLTEAIKEDHSDSDCFLVAVMTHGGRNGCLYDVEGTSYSQEELWKPFLEEDPDTVTPLSGKPKIFIIQACRGDEVCTTLNTTFT